MTQPNPFGNTGPANALNQPVDEFELMRRRLKARGAATGEGQQRQLGREFARLGNLDSGAALKVRQQAAQEAARQTSEGLQDVNILEAQTRRAEREGAADRGLQRELGQLSATTALEQARIGQETSLGTARIGQETSLGTARIGAQSALNVAQLGAKSDLEIAQLQGANQFQIAELQAATALKERRLIESGTDARLAKQISANKDLFDLDLAFKEKGLNLQQTLADHSINQAEQELVLNKAATVMNSLDPLLALGFSGSEVKSIINSLDLPFGDEIGQIFEQKQARQAAEPPAPRKPTNEEKFTNAIGRAPKDIVNGVNEVLDNWSRDVGNVFG